MDTSKHPKWVDLDDCAEDNGRFIDKVQPTGYCIMDSVRQAVLYDCNKLITFESMKNKITNKLCTDNTKYMKYYGESANQLVDEVLEFFHEPNFISCNACDLLLLVIADILKLKIFVYQEKHDDKTIQILPLEGDNYEDDIHLIYTHNNKHSGGNHYDIIILTGENRQKKLNGSLYATPQIQQIQPTAHCSKPQPVPQATKKKEVLKNNLPPAKETVYTRTDVPAYFKNMEGMEDVEILDLTTSTPSTEIDENSQDTNYSENSTQDMNSTEDFSSDEVPTMKKGVPFPIHLFTGMEPEEVERIPPEINNLCCYRIKCTEKEYAERSSDRRWFLMNTSSRVGLLGKKKTGKCQGSYFCNNPKCSYLSTEGQENEKHFNYLFQKKTCRACGVFAKRRECPAGKMIEYNRLTGTLEVFHFGQHTCVPKEDRKANDEFILQQIQKYPNMHPKQLQVHCIKEKVDSADITGAQEVTKKLADRSRIRQLRAEILQPSQNVEPHSFEAVAIFKQACDKVDSFYIFQINDGRMNPDPDLVFKTSRIACELGLLMDQENEIHNVLMDEDAYFDGAHNRCRDFISLALWLYHTSMRKLLKLACMECRTESSQTIGMFFKIWNKALAVASGRSTPYFFNPKHIMVDSAGSNYRGIKEVFGLNYMNHKLISCQWHFLNIMEQVAVTIENEKDRTEFLQLCHALCQKKTVDEYKLCATRLHQIAAGKPVILRKLEWWHVRRWHVFAAFRFGPTHAGCNLAEPGNAVWKESGRNLNLLDGAKTDIALFLLQDEEVQMHKVSSVTAGGCGPNDLQRASQERKKQRLEAQGLADIVTSRESLKMQLNVQENPEYFLPSENSSHKPPNSTSKGVEGVSFPTNEDGPARGRGRGSRGRGGRGRGKGKGRGKTSKLPSATDIARRILQAEKFVIDDASQQSGEGSAQGSIEEINTPPVTPAITRNVRSLQRENLVQQNVLQPQPPEMQGYAVRRSTRGYNPPFVTFFGDKSKYKCIGCDKYIFKKDYPHPRDLMFTLKAIRPYLSPYSHQWKHPEKEGYFHLSLSCLQKHDKTIEMRQATITDQMFMQLSQQQLQFLQNEGILEHITRNKRSTI